MSLRDRLTDDLKLAMKSRDQLRMDVIRMIKAAILHKERELKKDLDDAEMSRVMTALITQRREADQYERAQRTDLAAKERQEISIIEQYLPTVFSAHELQTLVATVVAETGARSLKDMGLVMKTLMARVGGQRVDGTQLSELVRAQLQ